MSARNALGPAAFCLALAFSGQAADPTPPDALWIYSFWPMQKDTSRGAGWSLILDVKDQQVWRAYWIAE